jgi:hypothetical protein
MQAKCQWIVRLVRAWVAEYRFGVWEGKYQSPIARLCFASLISMVVTPLVSREADDSRTKVISIRDLATSASRSYNSVK